MVPADRRLLELLSDGVCHEILLRLLTEGPQTQRELRAALGVGSGAISRRMGDLEGEGVVIRARSHGPYDLVLPEQTRALITSAKQLAADLLALRNDEAQKDLKVFRKAGLAGGHLRDRAREEPSGG